MGVNVTVATPLPDAVTVPLGPAEHDVSPDESSQIPEESVRYEVHQ